MPLDRSIKKVLIIGAGPITIGQACEFDYSGTQACKALKEEGCQVVLLNSNPATIMTDGNIADIVYIEPITSQVVEKIIQQEQPDSLLPTMGGQTALNCARQLAIQGILNQYNVKLIGLTLETIEKSENREVFKEEVTKIGLKVPKSFYATNWQEVVLAQQTLGFPLIIRCSFTLGGQGGGIAYDFEDLKEICAEAFSFSKELLVEQSIIGWKEYELEVMRDRVGNCIVVCGIENIDPMGVHTGDSITVAPIQTLTDKEYQAMRKDAFMVMETIGMTSGGCNVQFAVNPDTGERFCIEVNPRVSRSSALASKATGFPIAKIAAKLAIGYTLDELQNEVTAIPFPASFEPVMDYVVTKFPRFNFDKFPTANQQLTTHMKSIGEVIAIGRTFKDSLNKAISSLDIASIEWISREIQDSSLEDIKEQLKIPHPKRLWLIYEAFSKGCAVEEVHDLTGYDLWFLEHILELAEEEKEIANSSLQNVSIQQVYCWKQMGFSDQKLAFLLKCTEEEVFQKRQEFGVHSVYKRIDTCSAEFPNETAYMYSTYDEECESQPTSNKKVLILGSGPNRIGQGIEFDYCCVHAINAIKDAGYESVILNCNPETVSTDYDITDRLYLEPLTFEHVAEVVRVENPLGTIIQFGGQTPINIGKYLHKNRIAILGTPFGSIDLAENRKKFRTHLEKIGLQQPKNDSFSSIPQALRLAKRIGFPLILRPSYVIGGNAIQVIQNEEELRKYLVDVPLQLAAPILMESFLENALEVEVDAISDGKDIFICGIVEHVEKTGIHSGDSMSFLFPYQLSKKHQEELVEQTRKIGFSLKIIGLFNVQFAVHNDELLIIEVNPRAARTIPLLAKVTGLPLAQIATKCILGLSLQQQKLRDVKAQPKFLGLKIPVFPFSRLHIENKTLGPQMKSTGEVLCIGKTVDELFLKARIYASENREILAQEIDLYLPHPDKSVELNVYAINKLEVKHEK